MISSADLSCDYLEGAHPKIIERLAATNLDQDPGYGEDAHCERARGLIRAACDQSGADVHFFVGGTQANAAVIGCAVPAWQCVLAARTGHICDHEAGAIEAGGHKVVALPGVDGKITASQVRDAARAWADDPHRAHILQPGMVYLSQPTEYGTLYGSAELEGIAEACRAHGMLLFVDGARLAYGLAAESNDVSLADVARLADVFTIGGTKCGALFGEAVVVREAGAIPRFFTQIKQRGALLAKGRLLGLQFEVLFEDGLYGRIGERAVREAQRLRGMLAGAGYPPFVDSPTNQVFVAADESLLLALDGRVGFGVWERLEDSRTVIRLATSWATPPGAVDAVGEVLAGL
ncbi:beta-eliminating lyase-related protein [Actinomyces sp. B33]|uniref:threonine aldolase family protein n=1 Tax=Actinomyces sp. B33 TaxID=2942131 RepID=UPI002341AA3C|nr:beta-eliminating lyase-related protein [Actinomyces sp. B33]MDC4233747.1 beta-eliminating lyase-related protein [Actinomyces sp. B33]